MGFGDALGDAWDAFKDTGEQSLGVAMDYAKATQDVAEGGSPWQASRTFNRSFANRRQNFLSEHKTLSAIAGGAAKTLAGGLYALSLPAHAQMRSLSALALYTGLPGNPVGDRDLPSLKQAWRASEKVSFGQAVMLNTPGNNPEGINWRNAWKYGDQEKAKYDSEFSWTTGTFDALMIFTDPLIVAGKGAHVARQSREAIKADDIAGLAKAKGGVRTTTTVTPARGPEIKVPPGFVAKEPGIYYHGSNKKIEALKDVDDTGAMEQLYGPGFYTTESQQVAGSYKAKGEDPDLYGEVMREMHHEGLKRPDAPTGTGKEAFNPPKPPWDDKPFYYPTNDELDKHAAAVAKYQEDFAQRRQALMSKYQDEDQAWEAELDRRVASRAALHSVRWKGDKPPKMIDLDKPADSLFWETLAGHTPAENLPGNEITNASHWQTRAVYNLDKQGIHKPPPPVNIKWAEEPQRAAAWRAQVSDYDEKVQAEAQRIADEENSKVTNTVTPDSLRELLSGDAGLEPNAPARDVYRQWSDLFEWEDGAFADSIMHGVRREFQEMGYDGFTHRGGHIIGHGYNHQVNIWFDTSKLELGSQAKGAFVVGPAEAAKTRRETVLVPGDPTDLTRRQRRVVRDHESLVDATEGTSAYQNYLLFSRHGVTNAAGLGSVLSQAKHEPGIRSLVLRHSMGDADATAALSAQRQDLIDQVNRMNRDLDDQIFPEFGTKDHDGLFDANYWDTPEARAELLRQRDESEGLLDTYDRTLGDDQKLIDSAMPTSDEAGLGASMIKRTHATKRDLQWMKGQSAYYVQPGVGGIVTRVLRSPRNMQPSGYVNFHDAAQGISEVDAFTKRIPGLLPEERSGMMERYILAPDDNARRQVLEGIEDDAFDALGRRYGYAHEDMLELKRRFIDERNTAWAKSKGGDKIFGFNAAGQAEKRPLGEADLDNGMFTMPIDEMKRILHRNSGRYQALKNVSGTAFSMTDQMLDLVNDFWKFQALFRGGYPIRNAADGQLRMMAFLGAHSYLGIQKEALGTWVRNDLGKTKDFRAGVVTKRPMLGEGERDLGPYERLSDAMGRTDDEARAYYESISGVDNISSFISGKYHSMLDNLRGTGRWVSKKGDEDGYDDDLIRVVNQHFRNSAITQRLLKGQEPERIVAWLKSGSGRALRRRMVFGNDSAEALVLRNIENLNHVLPREYWARFAERPMVADDIAEIWGDNLASRPIINAEQIAYSQGQGTVAEGLQKLQKAYFKGVSLVTDDAMGRHPLFVALYRGHQIELMKRMDPKMKGVLELADQKRIEQQARAWARREMKGIMFDVAQKSDLAHFVRFIMPFYAAWHDAFTKYGRLLIRDPSRFGYLAQLWTAPNDAAFLEVTNSDGKSVDAKDSKLSDDEGVVIPLSWAKAMGVPWSPKISKSSFNIALQGDPLWLPGWGPMGTSPVNQMIRKTDNADLATVAEELGVLPFGVQDFGTAGWKAFLAGGLRQEGLSEGRRQRLLAQVMQTMYFDAARAGKPEPSWKDIKSKYRELLNLRRLTSALSPVSVQYQSPYQFYIDQSHAYDAQVGKKYADFAEADKAFLKDFGEDYYIFRMSMSKTNVAIAPSKRADKAARKVKDLIDSNPRYASLFIGPDNTGEYDRNVYTLQQGRRIGETAQNWRDTYDDPREAIRLNRVEQGWIEYQRVSARINAVMESRGLTSINQTAATDLRQLKHDWIERVAGEGGPGWGEAWYEDYQNFGSSAVTGFLGAAKQAIKDDRVNTRPDIQALSVYIDARSKVRQVLQARYKAGGSASITSQSNGDLATIWAGLATRLRQDNVYFEDYWTRYLERDDLTKVVR